MLKAFKNQLRELADDKQEFLSLKLCQALGVKECRKETDQIRSFILVIPEMIQQIRAWAEDDRLPAEVKRLHGYMLTYLYHPHDFLPEEPYGFFGYLDDAYFVGKVYAFTLLQSDPSKLRFISGQTDFSTVVGGWLSLTRRVLPNESRQIDELFRQLTFGDDSAFEKALAGVNS